MSDTKKILERLDAISETVTRTETKLNIIDTRGTTASVKAIKDLDDKYAKKIFRTMAGTITALGAVAWSFIKKEFTS